MGAFLTLPTASLVFATTLYLFPTDPEAAAPCSYKRMSLPDCYAAPEATVSRRVNGVLFRIPVAYIGSRVLKSTAEKESNAPHLAFSFWMPDGLPTRRNSQEILIYNLREPKIGDLPMSPERHIVVVRLLKPLLSAQRETSPGDPYDPYERSRKRNARLSILAPNRRGVRIGKILTNSRTANCRILFPRRQHRGLGRAHLMQSNTARSCRNGAHLLLWLHLLPSGAIAGRSLVLIGLFEGLESNNGHVHQSRTRLEGPRAFDRKLIAAG